MRSWATQHTSACRLKPCALTQRTGVGGGSRGALELDQLPVREIITSRPKVIWINQDDPHDQIWRKTQRRDGGHRRRVSVTRRTPKPEAKKRDDGSWLIDAMIDLESVEKALPGFKFGGGAYSEYQTLAGFVVKTLGRVPREGETFETQGYIFEVLDMDRHRVDKGLAMPAKTAPPKS